MAIGYVWSESTRLTLLLQFVQRHRQQQTFQGTFTLNRNQIKMPYNLDTSSKCIHHVFVCAHDTKQLSAENEWQNNQVNEKRLNKPKRVDASRHIYYHYSVSTWPHTCKSFNRTSVWVNRQTDIDRKREGERKSKSKRPCTFACVLVRLFVYLFVRMFKLECNRSVCTLSFNRSVLALYDN